MKSIKVKRSLHRKLATLISIPLFFTIISGSVYAILKAFGVYPGWLIKMHTGNFSIINLQPIYSPLLGLLSLSALATGLTLLRRPQKQDISQHY
jgi:hypothetical protein